MLFAADDYLGAFRDGVLHVFFDFGYRVCVDQGSDGDARLGAWPYFQRFDLHCQLRGERVVYAILNQDAVRADASLTRIAILRKHRAVHCSIQIGIVEYEEGRVTTQFERELLNGRSTLLHEYPPYLRRTGEGDLANGWIAGQLGADFARAAGYHAEHSLRHARTLRQFSQCERGERRLCRRLEHHRATRGECRACLPSDHRGRKVPRGDSTAHAYRLLDDDDALVGLMRRNDISVDALAFLGEPLDEGGRVGDLTFRFGQRLALLRRHDQRQVVLIGHHQVEPLAQNGGAFLGCLRAPRFQCAVGRFNAPSRLASSHLGNRTDHSTRCRIGHRNGLPTIGVHPLPVEITLLVKQLRVLEQGLQRVGFSG